jgi:hypothetical protein
VALDTSRPGVPVRPVPAEPVAPSPALVRAAGAGVVAAGWTVLVGLAVVAAPVLLAWLGSGAREPLGDVLAVAAAGWLLALGATLSTADASWGLLPLGLTLVLVVLASRAIGWSADTSGARTRSALLVLVAGFTGTGAVLAAAAALLSGPAVGLGLRVDPGEAAARALLVLGSGAAVGLLREGRWRVDGWPARLAVPALGAVAVLVAVSAAATTVALVASFGTVMRLVGQIDPGAGGVLALLVLSLAYLPTAVVWALAVLVGPGVTLGAGVSLTLGGATTGPLPGVPLLGAVPTSVPGWWLAVAALAGLGAGALAALLLVRRLPEGTEPLPAAAAGAGTGLLAGAAAGLAAWAATGPAGPGDLGHVGTTPAAVAAVVALVVGAAAALGAAAWAWRSESEEPPPDDTRPA